MGAVTVRERLDVQRLMVLGAATSRNVPPVTALLRDGTAIIAVGGAAAGGFGVESVKSMVVGDPVGRWWLLLGCAAGVILTAVGVWLRHRARPRPRIGIVVTVADGRRGIQQARVRAQQAEQFSRSNGAVTVRISADLATAGIGARDVGLIERLADETLLSLTLVDHLAPDAARIDLIPTMPLHVAFRYGARLGHTHARSIVVHAVRQGEGTPAYFAATVLRASESATAPLIVERFDVAADVGASALALDLQGRGSRFRESVRQACVAHDFGKVILLRNPRALLAEDADEFTAVVDQVCQEWQAEGHTGRAGIFLTGPVAIAVALGARLASPEPTRWTPFSLDGDAGYEPFPRVRQPR